MASKKLETSLAQLNTEHVQVLVSKAHSLMDSPLNVYFQERIGKTATS